MKSPLVPIVVIVLIAISLGVSFLPASFASSQTVMFALDLSSTNVHCNAEDSNIQMSQPTANGFASLFIPKSSSASLFFCTSSPYTGSSLTVTSASITIYGACVSCSPTGTGQMQNKGPSGNSPRVNCNTSPTPSSCVFEFQNQATTFGQVSTACSKADATTFTASGIQSLASGAYYELELIFSSTKATSLTLCTGPSTPSMITIMGNTQAVGVPQFPYGMLMMIALLFPAVFILKGRLSSYRTNLA